MKTEKDNRAAEPERKSAVRFLKFTACFLMVLLLACGGKSVLAFSINEFIDGNVQRVFTSADGLGVTASNAITQTRDGFIWIGGYGGLVRYDGREFQPYEYENELITGIMDLTGTQDGALYVGTADKGLFRYFEGEWSNLSRGSSAFMSIQSLAVDENQNVWFGTSQGAGFVSQDGQMQLLDAPELEGKFIQRLLCLPDGSRIFITRKGELYRYDGTQCKRQSFGRNGREDLEIRCASYDPYSGKIYIGTTGNKVIRCNPDFTGKIIYTAAGLKCINDILVCRDDVVWLSADNGVAYFNRGHLRIQKLMIDNSIDKSMIDEEGNFWFVSSRQGVLEISESRFTNISQSAGLQNVIVNAVCEMDDRLYVGHDEGMLILNAHTYRVIEDSHFERLEGERIRDIKVDQDGNLWIATRHQGLLCFRKTREWAAYTMAENPELRSDSFRSITLTQDGALLCGTENGAYLISEDGAVNVLEQPELLNRRILSAQMRDGIIYLGTDGYGLYLVKDGEIIRHYTKENGLSSDVIMKIEPGVYREGFWLITGDKLHFLSEEGDLQQIQNLKTVNNLGLAIRSNGEAWLLTGSSIFRTTEKSLLKDEEPLAIEYSHEEGLCYEVTANGNHCVRDFLLYICGSGGISSLNMHEKFYDRDDFRLNVDSLRLDGCLVMTHEGKTVNIAPDVQRIDLNAHVLTYGYENPDVFYYLEGFDTDKTVVPFENLGQITYTNLNGGSYIFHFGITDKNTGEVLQESVVSILKKDKWHEDRRVQAAGLLALLILLSVISWRIAVYKARKAHRKEIAELEKMEKLHLREAVYIDFLTGIHNRNYLEVWMEKILPEAGFPVTFVTIDCNNLKKINDTYGHKQGDLMLKTMADLLKKHFAGERFTVIRMGGDEYLVLCCDIGKEDVADIIRILHQDAAEYQIEGIPITFCSGSYTQEDREKFDFEEGLRISDLEMLKEKSLYHGRRQ